MGIISEGLWEGENFSVHQLYEETRDDIIFSFKEKLFKYLQGILRNLPQIEYYDYWKKRYFNKV